MNANLKLARRTALAVSLALGLVATLAGCASSPPATPPEIVQRIENARTPEDHASLATYYTEEAARARQTAALHRKMAKSYSTGSIAGRGGASMPLHCNAIVESYERIANEDDGLAASHLQMAKQVKQ